MIPEEGKWDFRTLLGIFNVYWGICYVFQPFREVGKRIDHLYFYGSTDSEIWLKISPWKNCFIIHHGVFSTEINWTSCRFCHKKGKRIDSWEYNIRNVCKVSATFKQTEHWGNWLKQQQGKLHGQLVLEELILKSLFCCHDTDGIIWLTFTRKRMLLLEHMFFWLLWKRQDSPEVFLNNQ